MVPRRGTSGFDEPFGPSPTAGASSRGPARPIGRGPRARTERGVGYLKHNEIADRRAHGTAREPPIERFVRGKAAALWRGCASVHRRRTDQHRASRMGGRRAPEIAGRRHHHVDPAHLVDVSMVWATAPPTEEANPRPKQREGARRSNCPGSLIGHHRRRNLLGLPDGDRRLASLSAVSSEALSRATPLSRRRSAAASRPHPSAKKLAVGCRAWRLIAADLTRRAAVGCRRVRTWRCADRRRPRILDLRRIPDLRLGRSRPTKPLRSPSRRRRAVIACRAIVPRLLPGWLSAGRPHRDRDHGVVVRCVSFARAESAPRNLVPDRCHYLDGDRPRAATG
jgi:hypothetical protein